MCVEAGLGDAPHDYLANALLAPIRCIRQAGLSAMDRTHDGCRLVGDDSLTRSRPRERSKNKNNNSTLTSNYTLEYNTRNRRWRGTLFPLWTYSFGVAAAAAAGRSQIDFFQKNMFTCMCVSIVRPTCIVASIIMHARE